MILRHSAIVPWQPERCPLTFAGGLPLRREAGLLDIHIYNVGPSGYRIAFKAARLRMIGFLSLSRHGSDLRPRGEWEPLLREGRRGRYLAPKAGFPHIREPAKAGDFRGCPV